jgi:hypothetical protein
MVIDHGQVDVGMALVEDRDGPGDQGGDGGGEAGKAQPATPEASDLPEFLLGVVQARQDRLGMRQKGAAGVGEADRSHARSTSLVDPTFYRSPGEAIAAPPEVLAYVAAYDPAGRAKDAMAVVDVDPASSDYGRVVGRAAHGRQRAAPLRLERLLPRCSSTASTPRTCWAASSATTSTSGL